MIIPSFGNLKIRAKLISVTLFLVLIPLLCVAYLSVDRFGSALRNAAEEDLEHLVRNIYSMCKVQQDMVQNKMISDLNVAREVLYRSGPGVTVHPETQIRFDAVNQITKKTTEVTVPLWKVGDTALSKNTSIVDEVQNLVGGTCTIFQLIEGERLLRISTNVVGKDGRRGIGTYIPPESPVVQAIVAGRKYEGRAYVVDDWYITAYEPIRQKGGAVIGALYVGVKERSAYTLKDQIKNIKVGETGYVYIMDSKGVLKIHPAREGASIINSQDSSGFAYIRAMIEAEAEDQQIHLLQALGLDHCSGNLRGRDLPVPVFYRAIYLRHRLRGPRPRLLPDHNAFQGVDSAHSGTHRSGEQNGEWRSFSEGQGPRGG
ncbi:MAG: Cache 3/Cache 2 fusion domain-containing protein [Deltaproteobacteria bacterium]